MDKKKIIIIAGIALGVIASGIGAYIAWQQRGKIAKIIPGLTETPIPAAPQAVSKMTLLSSQEVVGYWLVNSSTTESQLVYAAAGGDIVRRTQNGSEEKIVTVKNVLTGTPSFDGRSFFVHDTAPGDHEGDMIDVASGKTMNAFLGVLSAAWNAQSAQLAMAKIKSESQPGIVDISVADVSGKNVTTKTLASFAQQDFDLQWPVKDRIFLVQKPSAEYESEIWSVDVKTGALQKFASGRGLMVEWSRFGDRALKLTTDTARKAHLSMIDGKGNTVTELNFLTLPEKCVIVSPKQMYCAVPRDQDQIASAALPDDYLKRKVYFKDGIYSIDLETNGIKPVFEDETPIIDATRLTLVGDKLLFINRYDNKLYALSTQ